MPMVSTTSKKYVTKCHEALKKLEHDLGNAAENIRNEFIFEAHDYNSKYSSKEGPTMIAVAVLESGEHALHVPEYLTEIQASFVLELFLRDADNSDHILVFSDRELDLVKRNLYGKVVDVKNALF